MGLKNRQKFFWTMCHLHWWLIFALTKILFLFRLASLGGLLFGYDIGIISGAKIQIQKEIGLSCLQIELIVAMLPVGAFVASLGGGKFLIASETRDP